MPTDDERRAVAARLREAASYYESMKRDVDFYPVESAIGLKPAGETAYTPESVRSIADLIEPSTQCPYYHSDRHRCSAYDDVVDRDALLALADELERPMRDSGYSKGIAYRIREALGVER